MTPEVARARAPLARARRHHRDDHPRKPRYAQRVLFIDVAGTPRSLPRLAVSDARAIALMGRERRLVFCSGRRVDSVNGIE